MHQEKYTLTWHTYSDHLKSMMKDLMMNEDFSDVTLVTEDKKQIMANRGILSACSPVFKDILNKDKNLSSVVYLRGIQYSEMESIIQFIYLSKAQFYEKRMDEFLAVAKSLEIGDLCNMTSETNESDPEHEPNVNAKNFEEKMDEFLPVVKPLESGKLRYAKNETNHEPETNETETEDEFLAVEIGDLCEAYNKSETKEAETEDKSNDDDLLPGHQLPLMKFEEPTFISNKMTELGPSTKYYCELCHKTYSEKRYLKRHKQSAHDGIKYP